MSTFEDWIARVESGAVVCVPGLLHASLEHRSALRAAFEAGEQAEAGQAPPLCERAPDGWWCSRSKGHPGPCAARRRYSSEK